MSNEYIFQTIPLSNALLNYLRKSQMLPGLLWDHNGSLIVQLTTRKSRDLSIALWLAHVVGSKDHSQSLASSVRPLLWPELHAVSVTLYWPCPMLLSWAQGISCSTLYCSRQLTYYDYSIHHHNVICIMTAQPSLCGYNLGFLDWTYLTLFGRLILRNLGYIHIMLAERSLFTY